MIHIINFLVKAIMTVVFICTCGVGLMLLTIVLWDIRFWLIGSKIQMEYIWGAKEK